MKLIKELGTLPTGKTIKHKNGREYADSRPFGLFLCSFCNNEIKKPLRDGKRDKSCGCNRKYEKHGMWKHPIYSVYRDMLDRCNNKNNRSYNRYGGRGIKVCEEWKKSFTSFAEDMLPSYVKGLTLDREDNNKGYNKENCRWETRATQVRNTTRIRSNNTLGYRGIKKNGSGYSARIMVDKINLHLGTFKTKLQAARAYDNFIELNNLQHTKNHL